MFNKALTNRFKNTVSLSKDCTAFLYGHQIFFWAQCLGLWYFWVHFAAITARAGISYAGPAHPDNYHPQWRRVGCAFRHG
jgi:hypothetical protein